MEFNEKLYWLFIKASLGQKDAKWEVVEYYFPRIKELCNGDKDMEHNMILSIYELFDVILKNFELYFKEVNEMYMP